MSGLAKFLLQVISVLARRLVPQPEPPSSFEMFMGDHIVKTTGSTRREIS